MKKQITARMDRFGTSSLPLLLICSLIIHPISAAKDTIDTSQIITDGETLVSSGGIFELGFFGYGNSSNRYVGIWYKNITVRTYAWVANRETPLMTKSGVLKVIEPGILALFDHTNGTIVWSSNATQSVGNPSARLLDSGNLVVKDADDNRPESFLWQSFDYPGNTYLPGMLSLGWNLVTGAETYLSSWRSDDDPSPGEFTGHLDPTGYPQLIVRKGKTILYRVGPWNGLRFSGAPAGTTIDMTIKMNKNEVRYGDDTVDKSAVTRVVVTPNGVILRDIWNRRTTSWTTFRNIPVDGCDDYNSCGANGLCDVANSPPCGCLDRFVPNNSSNGCFRRLQLNCQDDVFLKYTAIRLPDTRNSTTDDQITTLADCEVECKRNCTCTAYTHLNISGSGSGCLFYYRDLIDIRTLASAGQDLYIRVAFADRENDAKWSKRVILIVSFTTIVGTLLLLISITLVCNRNRNRNKGPFSGRDGHEIELTFFNLSTILKATDNFSDNNKLGEGGFGPVYKGKLEDGVEIAVKRLSKTSSQGVDELKNEVILIAKLQHRNLVKLLGCCIQRSENMLIYEYMPNSSLDLILFDQTKSMLLDWQKRFNIINGIAKGLLYLHQDSTLRIIHRDLKASNILLDADMNPKISDFGLARSFGGNETSVKTRRVIGTYGYMSPEYAMDGLFSIKSDVFSFGVMVIELVSGKRNRGSHIQDDHLNLVGQAWRLYKDNKSRELVAASLGGSFYLSQALRSIHVGLLCVQKCPDDRPSMSTVIFMLGNEVELPEAKQPGFFSESDISVAENPSRANAANSANQVTITLPDGR